MGIVLYLFFNGNCEEAMNFYKDATGGSIDSLQRFGDTPMPCDDDQKNKVMHAVMSMCGSKVMFSDTDGKRQLTMGDNFSISLDFTDPEAQKASYEALSAGGVATMPLQDTFWGATFGMCTDRFGINWMFNHDKPKA
jgi:PhnB protein